MNTQFQVGIVQNIWLWLLLAFLLGLLVEWLLEVFFFRRNALRRVQDYDQKLVSLQAAERDRDALSAKLDAAARANADLNARLQKVEGDCSAQLDLSKQANVKLNADLDALNQEKSGLLEKIAAFTAGAGAATLSIKAFEADKGALSAQLETANQANADLSAKFDAANQANVDLNARLKKLEGDYGAQLDASKQANVKLNADLDALNQEKSGLLEKVATFTAGAGAATLSIKTLEEDKGALSAELAAANQANADLSAKLDAANQANVDLNARLKKLEGDYGAQLDLSKQANVKLNADLDALNQEKSGLLEKVAAFTAGAGAATLSIKTLEADKGALSAQLETANQANADLNAKLDAANQANVDLNARLQKLEGDYGAQLDLAKQANVKLNADLDALNQEKSGLLEKIATFTAGAGAATLSIKALEDDKGALSAQLETANQVNVDLSAKLDAANQMNADLNARLQKLEGDYGAQLDLSKQANVKLNADLDALNQEKSGLLGKIAVFTAGAGAATFSIKALEEDKGALSAQLETANQMNADLNARLQKLEGDYGARFDAAEQTRVQLEREKAECSALAEKLRVELEQAQAELAARASVVAPEKELGQTLARADSTLEAETPSTPASVTEHKRRARQTIAPPASRDPEDETPYETACPQHLSDVYGIGSVFEQRLYGAGIGTFWQLYKMPFDQLRQILNLTGLQKESVDLKVIRADALRLAKETASKGRLWNGTLPDDLEPLEGIGPVYEKRLYDAGICTYAALAQTTPEQLEAICGAGGVRKPNFKAWIKQAQKLAARKK